MEPKTGSTDLVSLGNEEQVLKIVAGSIFNLWEAVNNLTRLQPTKRDRYRVTIPVCVDDGPAILQVIREHHAAWKANRAQAPGLP